MYKKTLLEKTITQYLRMHYYLLIIITILTITLLFSFASAFGQLEIPSKFSTFTNAEYGIEVEYPSEWKIFEDRVPGDYVTDIAVFVPSSEIDFKEYDSYKDFKKMDTRVLVFLDYSFFISKLNLNFALDSVDCKGQNDGFTTGGTI